MATSVTRKKQVRFGEGNEIQLLREVITRNPFKSRSRWAEIAEAHPLDCHARRVRERTVLLMNYHKAKNTESKKKSGIEEAYGEKEQFLEEVIEFCEEGENVKKQEKDRAKEHEQAGKDIRKRAMETLSKSDEKSTPTKKSASKDNVLIYLREKNERDNKNKEKIIGNKEKGAGAERKTEIELQREKFDMEREERRQQSEMMTELLRALMDKK